MCIVYFVWNKYIIKHDIYEKNSDIFNIKHSSITIKIDFKNETFSSKNCHETK